MATGTFTFSIRSMARSRLCELHRAEHALLVSSDNGLSWQASKALLPFSTGQFDPQIMVDPVDRQTVYASWLQNDKRDIIVARSLNFGRNWSFSWAERGREDADKPVLTVRGTDVYVGFNHDEKFFVAASHDAGQTFSSVQVNPNAGPGSSLAAAPRSIPWATFILAGQPTLVTRCRSIRSVLALMLAARPMVDAPGTLRCWMYRARLRSVRSKTVRLAFWARRSRWHRTRRAHSMLCGTRARPTATGAHLFFVFDHGRRQLVGASQCVGCGAGVEHAFRRWWRARRATCASRGWMRGLPNRPNPIVPVEHFLS